jgi:hypothetical protein
MPRRHEDHQAFDIAVGHALQDLDQHFGVLVKLIFRIGSLDELAEGERFTFR